MFSEKYSPKSIAEFVGNKKVVEVALNYVRNFRPDAEKKFLIFAGKTGVGKTSLARCIARELSYELLEIFPSDFDAKEKLRQFLAASEQKSLFFRGKMILIEEVDSVKTRGFLPEIIKMLQNSRIPVIITLNDPYLPHLKNIRSMGILLKFQKVHYAQITKRLAEICDSESLEYEKDALKAIAMRNNGDIRAAINDLESLCHKYDKIDLNSVKELDSRDNVQEIFEALKIIFKSSELGNALKGIENVDVEPELLFRWIEENVPLEYEKPLEVSKAYDFLSKADLFRSRIVSRQNWKMLKYFFELMAGGVSLSKFEKYKKFIMYKFPLIIKNRSKLQSRRMMIKEICSKISLKTHSSIRETAQILPLLAMMAENKGFKEFLKEECELEDEELIFLEKATF
jgi:replication factor C large subunit